MKYFSLLTFLFISLAVNATVLSSATTCMMADRTAEITLIFDDDENATLEIMYNQLSYENQNVEDIEYRDEVVNVLGINYGVKTKRYTTNVGTVITLVDFGGETKGTIQGRFTKDKVIELFACRTSVEWDY